MNVTGVLTVFSVFSSLNSTVLLGFEPVHCSVVVNLQGSNVPLTRASLFVVL